MPSAVVSPVVCIAFTEGVFQVDGVDIGAYRRIAISVTDSAGVEYHCRSYEVVDKIEGLLPSPGYKGVIVCGAMELGGFPEAYMEKLQTLATNGYDGGYPPGLGKWLLYASGDPPPGQ